MVGGQTGADMTRVDQISKVCELQYVEMKPGECVSEWTGTYLTKN